MTIPSLQQQIDAEAQRIAAFNDSEQTWQDCLQDSIHRRGRYCEHQVIALANHLVRNRIQREDAQRGSLVKALERIANGELGPNAGEVGPDLSQAYHAQGIARAALESQP